MSCKSTLYEFGRSDTQKVVAKQGLDFMAMFFKLRLRPIWCSWICMFEKQLTIDSPTSERHRPPIRVRYHLTTSRPYLLMAWIGSATLPMLLDIFFWSTVQWEWVRIWRERGRPRAMRIAGRYMAWNLAGKKWTRGGKDVKNYLRISLPMTWRSGGQGAESPVVAAESGYPTAER